MRWRHAARLLLAAALASAPSLPPTLQVFAQSPTEHASEPPAQADAPAETSRRENPYGVIGIVQDWLARANREYQGVIIKELSQPSTGDAPEDAIANAKDRRGEAAARRAYEAKLKADAEALARRDTDAGEQAKRDEDRRRAAETKRLADEARRKADEIARALAETPPLPEPAADAAANRAADDARRAEQRRHERAELEKAERERAAREAQKLVEASERQRQEERARARQRAEDEARRLAEAKRIEDEARRAAAEQRARAAQEEAQAQEQQAAAEALRHRKRRIVLTTEPIDAPEPEDMPAPIREPAPARFADARNLEPASDLVRTGSVRTRANGERWAGWSYRRGGQRCRNAGRRIRLPGRYTVASGDSLWSISRRFYRSGERWRRIFHVNRRRIADPDLIYPCQRLHLPKFRRR